MHNFTFERGEEKKKKRGPPTLTIVVVANQNRLSPCVLSAQISVRN